MAKKTNHSSQVSLKFIASQCELIEEYKKLPLLITPKSVLFPGQILPISSLEGLRAEDLHLAQKGLLKVGVLTDSKNTPLLFGTEAIITGIIKLSGGEYGAVLKGIRRIVISKISKNNSGGHNGDVISTGDKPLKDTATNIAKTKVLKNLISKVVQLNPLLSQEAITLLLTTDDPSLICDLITPYLSISTEKKLAVLHCFDVCSRMEITIKNLSREIELLRISSRIQDEVRNDLQENLKKNFLREQLVAIKRELGEMDNEVSGEEDNLINEIENLPLHKEARDAANKELEKLATMHPGSPDYSVSLNYLNWIKDLPWHDPKATKPKVKPSIISANRVLNRNHYGLKKVKERIIEYIALMQHNSNISGQILLLVGPPGVGKTSLAKSIAKALKKPFIKVSLGGVKDEADIRGHRRTYIGALPGRIIQGIKTAKTLDPVILLDEVDKLGSSLANGSSDLGSALLELLDPEQNINFTDHFLGFPFDLSKAVFITTANTTDGISTPLLDRMEQINISGYTHNEKLKIAQKHLIPSIRKEFNLNEKQFSVEVDFLTSIINKYTREAGVRQLRRELTSIGRKVVKKIVAKDTLTNINKTRIIEYLGQPKYLAEPKANKLSPGVSVGLAYTMFGGDILYIESQKSPTTGAKDGNLSLTGSLGKVMQESARTVHTYLLSHANPLGIKRSDIENSNIHIHFPDGATPKDGPSAGLVILSALVSLFTKKSFPIDLAMTGEITLRGKVLPVGGIKEKLIAAHRYGKKRVVIPRDNWFDLDELPPEVLKQLKIYPVDFMSEALVVSGLLNPEILNFPKPRPSQFKKRSLHKFPKAAKEIPQFLC